MSTDLGFGNQPLVTNANTAVTEIIRRAITEGRFQPGERLKEEELARELGISRTPVREALLILQAEGLVDAAPKRGATVQSLSLSELIDLYDLRALLEGAAARLAARSITPQQVTKLRESCDRLERLPADASLRELVDENLVFHLTVLEATGSARLAGMMRTIIEIPLVYRSHIWYSDDREEIAARYREITNALEAHDAANAELLMWQHIDQARRTLAAQAGASEEPAAAPARPGGSRGEPVPAGTGPSPRAG
jgi:DNA-binding GntR family transcriptional regulator